MSTETKRRSMWIEEALWLRIIAAAARDGRTASGWVRWAVIKALGGPSVAPKP